MPLSLSVGAVSLGMRPQDLIRRLHKPSCDNNQHDNGTGAQLWCLPHRKNSKQLEGRDAVRRLTGDVEELMVTQENLVCTPRGGNHDNCQINMKQTITKISEEEQKHVHEVSEDVHKQLNMILKLIRDLSGEGHEHRACQKRMPSEDAVELLEQLIAADLPVQLLAQLPVLEFETRKDVMNVCCALLWPGMPQQIDKQVLQYLHHHPSFFKILVEGYANEDTALHYGVVLRSCARHSELVDAFLASGQMFELIHFAKHPSIDISSDAFFTLREMILAHKELSAPWLETHFREFFQLYHVLLLSGEYMAERQAQKLLTEILLDKHFRKVMMAYVSSERHLQIHMNLLKDRSKVIQVEAFHVFKIFAVNPHKPTRVQQILYKNRDKLVALLESLQSNKPDDKKFYDEQRNVIEKLLQLSAPTSPTNKAVAGKECRSISEL